MKKAAGQSSKHSMEFGCIRINQLICKLLFCIWQQYFYAFPYCIPISADVASTQRPAVDTFQKTILKINFSYLSTG